MKRWALLVVGLYGLILAAMMLPFIMAAFWPELSLNQIQWGPSVAWGLVWIVPMMLAQAALLVVPVRIAGERPVAKRHVFWTIFAALLMMAVMTAAMLLAVSETVANNSYYSGPEAMSLWCSIVGGFWLIWVFVAGFYSGNRPPRTMMARLVRFLIAGSILELLVAVPTHIIARSRNYCCAGFGTFWGLAAGISVMLFAFGPAVFFLFVRRYKSLKPQTTEPPKGTN